jgi:hypothetical protein
MLNPFVFLWCFSVAISINSHFPVHSSSPYSCPLIKLHRSVHCVEFTQLNIPQYIFESFDIAQFVATDSCEIQPKFGRSKWKGELRESTALEKLPYLRMQHSPRDKPVLVVSTAQFFI